MEKAESLMARIAALMEDHKPYLNGSYDLYHLAGDVGASPRLVSTLINEKLKMTVRDYVNHHRIGYFIVQSEGLAGEGRKVPRGSLALSCGFNNRQTFSNAFRKYTTMSPSAYFRAKRV